MNIIRPNQINGVLNYVSVTVNNAVKSSVNAVNNNEVPVLSQVTSIANTKVNKTGDTLTVPIVAKYHPVNGTDMATYKYLQDEIKPVTLENIQPILDTYLDKTGGLVNGEITSTATPQTNNSAVTIQKVLTDYNTAINNVSSDNEVKTGHIFEIFSSSTPPGYLKCNGASVSKVTYANLYSVIGDKFNASKSALGAGRPWVHQYNINNSSNVILGNWNNYTNSPVNLGGVTSFVTKNRVYLMGGNGSINNTTSQQNVIYSAIIYNDGSIGAFQNSGIFPENISYCNVFVTINKVYALIPTQISNSFTVTKIYSATINNDGTIGSWSLVRNDDIPSVKSCVFLTKNRVYIIGGAFKPENISSLSSYTLSKGVYSASIDSSGNIGVFNKDYDLPFGISDSGCVVTKNRVYLIGGLQADGNNYTNASSKIYIAKIKNDGKLTTFQFYNNLPNNLYGYTLANTADKIYLISGLTGQYNFNYPNSTSTCLYSTIDSTENLSTFTTINNLPNNLTYSSAIIVKNNIYLINGFNNGYTSNTIYRADITNTLSSYETYYNGSINLFNGNDINLGTYNSTQFLLPNIEGSYLNKSSYYIKI